MTEIAGLPFWQLTFDAQGDTDVNATQTVVAEIKQQAVTDLIVFSHGWNNSQATARSLYSAFFSMLAGQLDQARTDRPVKVGLVGVFWPSQRWSDEPIPDFEAQAKAKAKPAAGGAAAAEPVRAAVVAGPPTLDPTTLKGLRAEFPAGADNLNRMAELLAGKPTTSTMSEFKAELDAFAKATAVEDDDGEGASAGDNGGTPRMLEDDPADLFGRYANQLRESGVTFDDGGGGEAGLVDKAKDAWHGAKEALRQLTYFQMKNRAGVVGRNGLGPFLGKLAAADKGIGVHLVGHSFGARLVSYSLPGLPAGPSPVKSLTLLEGAFSHFAFADSLPFAHDRKGGLAGEMARIDGPLTVCFSSHDDAVGRFYPLASIAARDDSAAAQDRFYRWGGMGHDGAQAVSAKHDTLQPAGPGAAYQFRDQQALNIDASDIVCNGGPPSGAHSDIVHPELTWVVLKAGRIVP
jgi:hypothetical protein